MLTALDLIALVVFTGYFVASLGGLLILFRIHSAIRLAGVAFIALGVGGGGLLALMSSKYWFGDDIITRPFIDVSLQGLAISVGGVLASVGLVSALAVAIGSWTRLRLKRGLWLSALGIPLLLVTAAGAVGTGTLIVLSRSTEPVVREATQRQITVAPGFSVALYLNTTITAPTSIAFGPDNRLYVSDLVGRIWAVADTGAGVTTPTLIADGFDQPVGIAWLGDDLYVASYQKVSRLVGVTHNLPPLLPQDVITGLPARLYPWHQNEGPVFGPDGRMYFAVGATSNSSPQRHPFEASVLAANPDGSDLHVYASGLRNAYDLAFNAAGDLFGGDNGPRAEGDWPRVAPPDELNHIVEGARYGFPTTYGLPSPDDSSRAPVLLFDPHAAPGGITFYHGPTFPSEYFDNAFITLWTTGDVYRVELAKTPGGNYLARGTPFAHGFLNPLDVTVGPDGSLYVADSGTNAIYRIDADRAPVGTR